MGRRTRLAIGAVALIVGVAVFWMSVSLYVRDRLYSDDANSAVCLPEGYADLLVRDPGEFRAYVAEAIAWPPGSEANPRGLWVILPRVSIEWFGFLFVPEDDYVHLIETMPACAAPRY